MKKYTYKNIKNGKKVYSDTPIEDKDLKLVSVVKDMRINKSKVTTK